MLVMYHFSRVRTFEIYLNIFTIVFDNNKPSAASEMFNNLDWVIKIIATH